jgi:hypothetical protein
VFLSSLTGLDTFTDIQAAAGLESNRRASQKDETVIRKLEVRIKTRSNRGAGTDNAVYFDIGPISWKLGKAFHNDFEKGATDTYKLKIPDGVHLTKADILWYRLHKKGLLGYAGLKDGFDGAWHPESVTLIVNDSDYQTIPVDTPLNSRCWFWRSWNPADSDLKTFAHSLRFVQNKSLNLLDKATGIFTTSAFKRRGISGWLLNPMKKQCIAPGQENVPAVEPPPMCVTGQVRWIGKSTDGLETIDLQVSELESCASPNSACTQSLSLDKSSGFAQPRYLRVENKRVHDRVHKNQEARICGRVLWDTDYEGWWEIHPRDDRDLPPLPSR